MTKLSGGLRILTGLVLLAGVIGAGYLGRSAWIIVPFTAAYTVSFIIGRIARWQHAMKTKGAGLGYVITGLLSTALSQFILVGLLYLIGAGIGALFGGPDGSDVLERADWIWAGGLGAFGAVAGAIIALMERGGSVKPVEPVGTAVTQERKLSGFKVQILDEAVTPANMFYQSERNQERSPKITEMDIAATESRLGVRLPETLRAMYKQQDGGNLNSICIPDADHEPIIALERMLNPFSGYNDLHACTKLNTVADSFLAFAGPDDEDYGYLFTGGTDKMVLLAQWYLESLFLDYNIGGHPRVGFVDFDHENWAERIRWWPSFEAFVAELRFYEDVD